MTKEMLELAERLERRLAVTGGYITVRGEEVGMIAAALRASAVAEPVACICQDQHRRGYCTEPSCPYAAPAAPVPASVREALKDIDSWRDDTLGKRPHEDTEYRNAAIDEAFDRGVRMAFYRCSDRARIALASLPALEAEPTREEPKATGAYQLTAEETSIIMTCAQGRLWARDHAVEAHRRAIRDSGPAPGNPFYDFMSEIDCPCPDLMLRRRHRQRIIEGEPK